MFTPNPLIIELVMLIKSFFFFPIVYAHNGGVQKANLVKGNIFHLYIIIKLQTLDYCALSTGLGAVAGAPIV